MCAKTLKTRVYKICSGRNNKQRKERLKDWNKIPVMDKILVAVFNN